MKTASECTNLDHLLENKLDDQELLSIRGGDGPEIDPDPEPIILPEDG